jgi:hypothetical protein
LTTTVAVQVADPLGSTIVSPALALLIAVCTADEDRLPTLIVAPDAAMACKKHAARDNNKAKRPEFLSIERHKATLVPPRPDSSPFITTT